jgi:aryl-alcohol dehydrogenase-like predicted oxidoreductase
MLTRTLGKSGIEVSALGFGCWAIGGPWQWSNGSSMGWGQVDDDESIRAIHIALDMGVNFFDTAANYGAGHSEGVLGKALNEHRDKVVIATKFGHLVDEDSRMVDDDNSLILGNVRRDCENSLRRLNTDYIDVYQLHAGDYDIQDAPALRDELERLVQEGKIRAYGWSTDDVERARVFAEGENCAAIQHRLHVLHPTPDMLALCDTWNVGSINKSPLGSGLLLGKYDAESSLPSDDWRSRVDFGEEDIQAFLAEADAVREVLTTDGRTPAQGALAWIWAYHERTIPIPGFRDEQQARDNAAALEKGPLTDAQMQQIDSILGRSTGA